ncbi:MAG: hypothetical protein ABEK59_13485 [Halobacteria archaeon]
MVLNKFLGGCIITVILGFLVVDFAKNLVWYSAGMTLAICSLIAFVVVYWEGFHKEPAQK